MGGVDLSREIRIMGVWKWGRSSVEYQSVNNQTPSSFNCHEVKKRGANMYHRSIASSTALLVMSLLLAACNENFIAGDADGDDSSDVLTETLPDIVPDFIADTTGDSVLTDSVEDEPIAEDPIEEDSASDLAEDPSCTVLFSDDGEGQADGTRLVDGGKGWIFVQGAEQYQTYSDDRAHDGSMSLKMDSDAGSGEQHTRYTFGSHDNTGTLEAYLYDDMDMTSRAAIQPYDAEAAGGVGNCVLLGWSSIHSSTDYQLSDGLVWHSTGVTRSAGWHHFKIIMTGTSNEYWVDGAIRYTESSAFITNFDWLTIGSGHGTHYSANYYDDILVTDCY
jgi:hypothetical protein